MGVHRSKILVIADDLTGAAEIGGLALQFGLSARILHKSKPSDTLHEHVTIINTASRSCEPKLARKAIRDVLAGYDLTSFNLIYKKIDSVLRGPVIAEIAVLLSESEFNKVLMIPANPSKHRIIKHGQFYLDGVPLSKTTFANDPLHPRCSAKVSDLLHNDHRLVLGSDANQLRKGRIWVPDIRSEQDIKMILLRGYQPGVLLAGGSDFFRVVLSVFMQLTSNSSLDKITHGEKDHFMIGSRSESSLESVRHLQEMGHIVFALPEQALRNESVFLQWTEKICCKVKTGRKVVITGPTLAVNGLKKVDIITQKLAVAGRELIENTKPGTRLYLEGGETASAFVEEMSWNHLVVKQVHDLGVVTLQPQGREIMITVKPGSYSWPKHLLHE